jgi:GNAT superfamily N-acetyltransferase
MITIEPYQVTPAVMSLFDIDQPTMPRAFNVLEGLNHGQILVDNRSYPTRAVVREWVYGTLYFGGEVDAAWLAMLVQHFRQQGEVGIGCWLGDPLNEMLPPVPDYDGRTLYFTERSPSHDGEDRPLPTGLRMLLRDENTFLRSFDYKSTLDSFGSVQAVLQHTLGVVILDGEMLACEAATGASTHWRIEVGVTTAEAYRRRGLATLACQRLIELGEARGYSTWWDCARQNIPSVRLARRLGYKNEREYRYVWWQRRE